MDRELEDTRQICRERNKLWVRFFRFFRFYRFYKSWKTYKTYLRCFTYCFAVTAVHNSFYMWRLHVFLQPNFNRLHAHYKDFCLLHCLLLRKVRGKHVEAEIVWTILLKIFWNLVFFMYLCRQNQQSCSTQTHKIRLN